jgi:hypothetical protein
MKLLLNLNYIIFHLYKKYFLYEKLLKKKIIKKLIKNIKKKFYYKIQINKLFFFKIELNQKSLISKILLKKFIS